MWRTRRRQIISIWLCVYSTDGNWREVWGGVKLVCMCESIHYRVTVRLHHRVHTEWQRPLSGVHCIMMEKLAQGSWGWEGCTPPLSLYLQSRAKLQCTLQLRGQLHSPYFISTLYLLCGLHDNQPGLADVSGEVGPDLLGPARLAADGRQLIRHLCGAATASRCLLTLESSK